MSQAQGICFIAGATETVILVYLLHINCTQLAQSQSFNRTMAQYYRPKNSILIAKNL